MKVPILLLACAALALCAGCATGPTTASYGPGSDSAYIKGNRNQRMAIVSDSELSQHRRQRANVSEEMALEAQKRGRFIDTVAMPFDLARRIGILR